MGWAQPRIKIIYLIEVTQPKITKISLVKHKTLPAFIDTDFTRFNKECVARQKRITDAAAQVQHK